MCGHQEGKVVGHSITYLVVIEDQYTIGSRAVSTHGQKLVSATVTFRGNVAMAERRSGRLAMEQNKSPEGWLSEAELVAATGISARNLTRWRGQGLIPRPKVIRLGAAGTASSYPPISVPMIKRLYELQREARDVDAWIWGLWLDDHDFPADIRCWAVTTLAAAKDSIAPINDVDHLETAVAAIPLAGRKSPLRRIYARVRRPSDRSSLIVWSLAVGIGITPPASLYDRSQPVFQTLKKATGLPKRERLPDRELHIERMSFAHLVEIIAGATGIELEGTRQVCRRIAALAAAGELVDWGAVDATLSRHTRRSLKARRISPPAAVGQLLAQWCDFTHRAALLPFLIAVRRSPDHSTILSQRLTIAERALVFFPKMPDGVDQSAVLLEAAQ